MASIGGLVGAASTSNLSSYTTASFTPAAGSFLVVYVLSSDNLVVGTVTDTQNLGWTLISSVNDGVNSIAMWAAQRTSSAVETTVTWDCSPTTASGARVGVIQGINTDPIIRQFATGSGLAASTPALTFSQAASTNSALLGFIGNTTNTAALTPPVGWTEISDAGWNTPTTGSEVARINSGETNTTITWGSASATAWIGMVIEIYNAGEYPGGKGNNYIDGYYGIVV